MIHQIRCMHLRRHIGRALLVGCSIGLMFAAQAVAWEPKKPVEFIIMAGPGGGADKMARLMQSVIEKHKFSPKPFIPKNKPSGAGAEALRYMQDRRGDNREHTVMVTLNSFYTTPLRQPNLGVDVLTFTPVARMAEDTFLLWVHADSGINSVDEFVDAAKAKGSDWIMAGTGKASADNLLTDLLNSAYGLNMKYVPFKGGGRVAKELAGRHADSTVNNPSEQLGLYKTKQTRPLAAFTPERLPLFNEAPTFKELGQDFIYFMQRSVVGAPGMSAGAEAFYRDVFQKVYNSDEWQTYMKEKSLQGEFLSGEALQAYWQHERSLHEAMLKKMGEIR